MSPTVKTRWSSPSICIERSFAASSAIVSCLLSLESSELGPSTEATRRYTPSTPIHRSAWKVNSRKLNFRFQVFLDRVGPSYRSQLQETLRVAVGDALFVCGAGREFIQEISRLPHRSVGVVGREHDPFHADLKNQ